MTCDHADCTAAATIRLRFGDGTWGYDDAGSGGHRGRKKTSGARWRQTYVRYCPAHADLVQRLFHVCDVGPVGREDGSAGPLPDRLRARTMTGLRV